ncbi:hypothetical protein ACHAXS_004212, partial [Conticribra weissflogii]
MISTKNSACSPGNGDIVERLKFLENEIKVMSTKVGNLIVKIDSLEGVVNDSHSKSNSENASLMSIPKSKYKASNGKKKKKMNAMKNIKRILNKGSESSSLGGKNLAWNLSCAIVAAVTFTLALGLGGENGRMDHVEPSLPTDEGLSAKSGKGIGTNFIEKERMPRVAEDSSVGFDRAFLSAGTDGDLGRMKGRDRLAKLKEAITTKLGKGVDIKKVSSFHLEMNDLQPKTSAEEFASNNIPRDLTEVTLYYPRHDGYCDTNPGIIFASGHETPEECCNEWYSSQKEECLLQSNMYDTTSPVASVSNVPPSSLSPTSALSTSSLSMSPAGNGEIHIDDASMNPSSSMTFPPSSISSEVSSTVSPKATFKANVFFGSDPQFCGSASLYQRDYRGTINTTFSGRACMRWGDTNFTAVDYPWAGLDENYCRNPVGDYLAWCFNEDGLYESCDVPLCNSCSGYDPQICGCASLKQQDYRGTINTTFSGKACMRWDTLPDAVDYPWAGLEENYCRNPDKNVHAWCFNEDGDFEFCDVPLCNACKHANFEKCGCRDGNQADYRGSIHTTIGGKECLNWEDTFYTPELLAWGGLEENYCRNPVQEDGQAWCFFGQGSDDWDYCDVPFCGEECENSDPKICGCRNSNQRDYRGTINTTVGGTECMRWEDTGTSYKPEGYALEGLEENYCRNPDGRRSAWCIDVEGFFQSCNVPYCDETSTSTVCQESDPSECECANVFEKDYTGTVNVTRSGLPCANWDDYNNSFVFETLPPGSLNYCRNPDIWDLHLDKRDSAWCYTKDKFGGPFNQGWDYCDIPVCEGNGATCRTDKTACGCRNVDFADYRGNNSYGYSMESCENWDTTDIIDVDGFTHAGLEG